MDMELDGIDGRQWARLAFEWGFDLETIAFKCQVSRRTISAWAKRGEWERRKTAHVKINYLLRQALTIETLSAFILPPTRKFGEGAPLGNTNREVHGIYGVDGKQCRTRLQEIKALLRTLKR